MALAKEITFTNRQYGELKRQIDYLSGQINSYLDTIDSQKHTIAELIEQRLVFERTIGQFNFEAPVAYILKDQIENKTLAIASNQRTIDRYLEAIGKNEREIVSLRERLSRITSPEYVVTKEGMKQLLSTIRSIDPKSVCVGTDRSNEKFVRWKHVGLIMKPDKNQYDNINYGAPLEIPLEPQVVTFFVERNRVTITPARGGTRFPCMSNRKMSHPHILNDNRPCFGDFAGPVEEAMADKDYVTLAALTEMFLSQAYSDDGAGMYWYNFIHPSITTGYSRNSSRLHGQNGDALDLTYIYEINNGNRPTVVTSEGGAQIRQFYAYELKDGKLEVKPFRTYEEYRALKVNFETGASNEQQAA